VGNQDELVTVIRGENLENLQLLKQLSEDLKHGKEEAQVGQEVNHFRVEDQNIQVEEVQK
jgi:hypothetical protein